MEILGLSVLHPSVMRPIKKNYGMLYWYSQLPNSIPAIITFHISSFKEFPLFCLCAFQDGDIDMISSDHSPAVPEMKLLDEGDFLKAWGGISSLQVFTYTSLGSETMQI